MARETKITKMKETRFYFIFLYMDGTRKNIKIENKGCP